jgi:hypothetical protein
MTILIALVFVAAIILFVVGLLSWVNVFRDD